MIPYNALTLLDDSWHGTDDINVSTAAPAPDLQLSASEAAAASVGTHTPSCSDASTVTGVDSAVDLCACSPVIRRVVLWPVGGRRNWRCKAGSCLRVTSIGKASAAIGVSAQW
jgi:hypothetical protein